MRQNDALQNHVLQNHVLQNEESYLRRAAINAALDVMRARRADRTVELEDLPAERGREDPRELRQALGRALAQLKTRPAEIFALRFFEGFSKSADCADAWYFTSAGGSHCPPHSATASQGAWRVSIPG